MLALSVPAASYGSPGGPALLACCFMLSRGVGRWGYVILLYGSRSCTTIESLQDQRKVFALRPLDTTPSLTTPVEACRPTSLLGYAASTGTVVATGLASANADHDNGAEFRSTLGARRRDERVAHPLDTKQGNRVEHALDVQHPT